MILKGEKNAREGVRGGVAERQAGGVVSCLLDCLIEASVAASCRSLTVDYYLHLANDNTTKFAAPPLFIACKRWLLKILLIFCGLRRPALATQIISAGATKELLECQLHLPATQHTDGEEIERRLTLRPKTTVFQNPSDADADALDNNFDLGGLDAIAASAIHGLDVMMPNIPTLPKSVISLSNQGDSKKTTPLRRMFLVFAG